ncbi:hypothetical protein BJP23_00490 [Aeromonas veronii bv. veronii]|nr:hypothetical protein BJP23_00490 [Aeromonas veronii bv. veronii]TNJ09514.1 hypothetical protein CF115_06355 [Aeromonas veronii]
MAQGCCRNGGFSLHCAIFCPKGVTPPMASAGFLARPMMACDRHEVVLLTLVVIGTYTSLPGLFSLI